MPARGRYSGKSKQTNPTPHEPMGTPTNRSTHPLGTTAVQQYVVQQYSTAPSRKNTHQQPTKPQCVCNSTTSVPQYRKKKKKKKKTDGWI